jgi:hypothetical protein
MHTKNSIILSRNIKVSYQNGDFKRLSTYGIESNATLQEGKKEGKWKKKLSRDGGFPEIRRWLVKKEVLDSSEYVEK